jgi:hypothetical protein
MCCFKCQAQTTGNFADIESLYLCMNDDLNAFILCDECAKEGNVIKQVKK